MLKYGYMKKAAPLFNRDKGATYYHFLIACRIYWILLRISGAEKAILPFN